MSPNDVVDLDADLANADWLKHPDDIAASLPPGADVKAYLEQKGLTHLPVYQRHFGAPAKFGGPGSGDFGHSGRPGEEGGSTASSGGSRITADLPVAEVVSRAQAEMARIEALRAKGGPSARSASALESRLQKAVSEHYLKLVPGARPATTLKYMLQALGSLKFGGPGSGDYGHAGRPGEIGGSAGGGGGGGSSFDPLPSVLSAKIAQGLYPRDQMPVVPGPLMSQFADSLARQGVVASLEHVDPRSLTPTQNQLDPRKVNEILDRLQNAQYDAMGRAVGERAMMISRDGHILDGHHRWAANVLYAQDHPGHTVAVVRMNTTITNLLAQARAFDQQAGLQPKDLAAAEEKEKDADQPYILLGGQRVLIATDEADGVARDLSASAPPPLGAASTEEEKQSQSALEFGGPGSGNYGHAGRPGQVGGSAPGGGGARGQAAKPRWPTPKLALTAKAAQPLVEQLLKDLPNTSRADAEVAVRLAGEHLQEAIRARDVVRPQLEALEKQFGGQLRGTQFELKEQQSLAEKIAREAALQGIPLEDAAEINGDTLRYTMSTPDDQGGHLTRITEGTLRGLQAAGFRIEGRPGKNPFKNSWDQIGRTDYVGLNVKITAPQDSPVGRYQWELQFHTPESIGVKDLNHDLYRESQRAEKAGDGQRVAELSQQMIANTGKLVEPPGMGSLSAEMFPNPPG
jgi:hypothetical protein